ncbi:MAG: hypothetical protein FWD75_07915 [Propionibacteriaceae bacterium]|nr:hypothetical protein [Propionibacteriaceae bacterium]
MLKFLKVLLIAVGVVLVVATIALLVWDIIQVNHLATTANAANMAVTSNPRWWIVLAAVGALLGGFGIGFGLGLPKRTFKQRLGDIADQDSAAASA